MEKKANTAPTRLIFYRGALIVMTIYCLCAMLTSHADGVSEGQFKQVIEKGEVG